MGFERFTKLGRSSLPKISIWSRGQIGFSVGAVNRFKLAQFNYVVFLFDAEMNRIGFLFATDKNEAGAIKLNKRTTGVMVGAKAFLDFYNIDYSETRQYTLKQEQELYVVSLNEKDATKNGVDSEENN